jgi:hypothetical protein
MSKASYFHGNVWVTVSSTWDIYTAHQMPCLIIIHGDKSERGYKCHFDVDLENYKTLDPLLTTFEDFIAVYTVHTADMSLALTNGWSRALESFCKERFQWDAIPSVAREAMLGYCG